MTSPLSVFAIYVVSFILAASMVYILHSCGLFQFFSPPPSKKRENFPAKNRYFFLKIPKNLTSVIQEKDTAGGGADKSKEQDLRGGNIKVYNRQTSLYS